jgi:hypothetical protein
MSDIDAMVAEVREQLDQAREGWEVTVTWQAADGSRTTAFRFIPPWVFASPSFGPISEADLVATEAKVAALAIKQQRDGRVR